MKKDYIGKNAIGYYAFSTFSGLEVLDFEYGINDYVIVRDWVHSYNKDEPKNEKIHRLIIKYNNNGDSYFNLYGSRYYLHDFMRL